MSEYSTLIFGCMGAVWTVLLGAIGYIVKGNAENVKELGKKLDALNEYRLHCVETFADRERNDKAHKEFYDRLAVHDSQIAELRGRMEK